MSNEWFTMKMNIKTKKEPNFNYIIIMNLFSFTVWELKQIRKGKEKTEKTVQVDKNIIFLWFRITIIIRNVLQSHNKEILILATGEWIFLWSIVKE